MIRPPARACPVPGIEAAGEAPTPSDDASEEDAMPHAQTDDGAQLHYRDYDFAPPWTERRTVIMAHGLRSSQETWHAWIPLLGRHYRVITFDARGRGHSSKPPPDFAFSMARYARDV